MTEYFLCYPRGMGFFSGFFCCLAMISFFNFTPFLSFERSFPEAVYQFRKMMDPQAIKPKNEYSIVLVGDSMTDYLGSSGSEIKKHLKPYYPNKDIKVTNFSVGSTKITTLQERLQNLTNYNGKISDPILNTKFDLIIIESFGHNPLNDPTWEDGYKKHNEVLDQARKMIKDRQPEAKIIFLATIAPHISRYAEGVANISTDERKIWAMQRAGYIKNHIEYAKKNNLPLINVYEKSLDLEGGGNIDLINTGDFIHPSVTGVDFISREIAEFIFNNRILPL